MPHPKRWIPVLLVGLGLAACIEPADRRPGLWLSGEVAEEGGGDWSFANEHREIAIETRTPWLIPHSVTTFCAAKDGRFFVGARNPETKSWVANVDRDPEVRIKIGDRLFEQRLVVLDDPAEIRLAYSAYAAKYGWPDPAPPGRPPVRYFEVVSRR